MNDMTLTEQVRQALASFHTANEAHEHAAAAAMTLKGLVGANESDRKRQQASMPPDDYARYTADLAEAEKHKAAAAAHLERVEKNLNVLRELLQHEVATINRAAARLAQMTAETYSQLQMNPPARPVVMRNVDMDNFEYPPELR